jgi:hypothetical protein
MHSTASLYAQQTALTTAFAEFKMLCPLKQAHQNQELSFSDKRAFKVPGPMPSGVPPLSASAATSLFCSVRTASASASTLAASANLVKGLTVLCHASDALVWKAM